MTSPNERLREARRKAGFETPSDAARALRSKGVNKNTLISHENGHRDISRKAAERYGELFNIDPGWLLYGPPDDRLHKIFARIANAPSVLQERVISFAEFQLELLEKGQKK